MSQVPTLLTRSWFILMILSLCFWGLRLSHIDNQKDGGDQERDFRQTLNHLEGKAFEYSGPRFGHEIRIPSIIYHYALSIPLYFSPTMKALRIWVVFFNFLALLSIFFIAYSLFDKTIATIASSLFTFAPFSVKFSVFLWNPNFLPFLGIIFFYFFWRCVSQEKSKMVLPLLIVIYITLSFHIMALAYLIALLLGWFLFPILWNYRYVFYGIIIILIFTGLYLYYDSLHDFANLRSTIYPPGKGGYRIEAFKSLQWLVLFSSNEISSFLEKGFDKNLEFFKFPYMYFWVSIPFFILSALIPLFAYFSLLKNEINLIKQHSLKAYGKLRRPESALILFLFCGPLFLITLGLAGEPRYILANSPAVFLAIGWALAKWIRENSPLRKKVIWGYLLLQFIYQAVLYIRLESYTLINS